jgi:Putative peptidoglycan binding domain/Bacterial SH3 domain
MTIAQELIPNPTALIDITLRRGNSSSSVKTLQVLLNYRGAGLTVDGDFGLTTEERVIEFQTRVRLEADGIVGPKTWAVLRSATAIARIPGSGINMRANPDRNAALVQTLQSEDDVVIVTRSGLLEENYRWFQVQAKQKTGWVREDLIQLRHTLSQPMPIVNGITIQSRPLHWWGTIDSKLEAIIRSALALGFRDRLRYLSRVADLNSMGALIVVYLFGDQVCGTGGCTMMVVQETPQGYQLISRIASVQGPLVVSNQKTNGYPDLIVYTAGGGIPAAYRRLRFNGKGYPTSPTAETIISAGTVIEGFAYSSRITTELAAPLVAV